VPVAASDVAQVATTLAQVDVSATATVPVAEVSAAVPSLVEGAVSETVGERAARDKPVSASGPAPTYIPVAKDREAMPTVTDDSFPAEGAALPAAPREPPTMKTVVANDPDQTVTGVVYTETRTAGEVERGIVEEASKGEEETAVSQSDGLGAKNALEDANTNKETGSYTALAKAIPEDRARGARRLTDDELARLSIEVTELRKSMKKIQQLLLSSGAITPAQYCRAMYGSPSPHGSPLSPSAADQSFPQVSVSAQASYDQTQVLTVPSTQTASVRRTDSEKGRLAAGLLAIFLGGLGVHKFYLGYTGAGVAMLLISIFGAVILIGPILMGLCGLIEGIIYLTKSDEDFQRTYVWGDKPWF
jgi:TM2 domain containing protein